MFDFIRKNTLKLSALVAAAAMLAACTGGTDSTDGDNTDNSGNTDTPISDSADTSGDNTDTTTPTGTWSYSQLAMGGGGYVTGVFSTSEEGLYYARTDVGGAYRWDDSKGKWLSLGYWVSEEDVGLLGIDGLAVDPDEPNKLYLLAATSYFSNGKTCVLISDDYGDTFEVVEISDLITAHGNGMGRQNGERIAVDPVNHDILYIGGRTGGLIKSTDGGKTWTKLQGLADVTSVTTANANGICTIVIDPDSSDGSACGRVFVGISKSGEANLFVSEDGGESWAAVDSMPKGLYPQRMRLDGRGNLIVTYGNAEGPWGSGTGSIRRLNIASGEMEDISPANRTFGDIAISPNDPDKMVAVTECVWMEQPNGAFGDEFYVTNDGGATWKCINKDMSFSVGEISWIADAAIHWCGSLAMNPYNDSEIKVTSGNGIFACDNIWDDNPVFRFDSKGIEETVPMGLVSVPEGPIITAVLDYDGFVNDDPFTYGNVHSTQAGAMTDIAVAYGNTDVWVKCGGEGFFYTLDAGETWKEAKSAPTNGANSGNVTVSADGSRFFWAPDSAYAVYYSDDCGETWTQSAGVYAANSLAGDPVNSDYIYASTGGSFYLSSDGGATFAETYSAFSSSMKIAVVPGKEGVVYIPAMGLQKSADHGQSFTRIDSAAGCLGVAVGKGVSDEQEALYIWGRPTADDPIGIYWSTDGGASWQPVSTEYQFGGMGNGYFIKGDNNVTGRCYISTVGLGVVVCDLNR